MAWMNLHMELKHYKACEADRLARIKIHSQYRKTNNSRLFPASSVFRQDCLFDYFPSVLQKARAGTTKIARKAISVAPS